MRRKPKTNKREPMKENENNSKRVYYQRITIPTLLAGKRKRANWGKRLYLWMVLRTTRNQPTSITITTAILRIPIPIAIKRRTAAEKSKESEGFPLLLLYVCFYCGEYNECFNCKNEKN